MGWGVHVSAVIVEARRGQQIALELELQEAVSYLTWVLGPQLWSSARIGCVLNHVAISPASRLKNFFFFFF